MRRAEHERDEFFTDSQFEYDDAFVADWDGPFGDEPPPTVE
jgi:hypothetical protein